jgi:hypothetical protein
MHKLQYILNTILNKLLNMCKFSYDSKIFFLLLSYYMYIFYFIVKFVRHIVQLSNFFYYLDQFISGELLHLLIYFFDKIYIYFLYFEKKDIIIFEQKIKILF